MTRYLFGILAIGGFLVVGCSDDENGGQLNEPTLPEVKIELTAAEIQAAQSMAAGFNCNFFRAVSDAAPDDNVVASPLSVQIFLAMMANISDDTGREEITRALGCDDLEALNSLCEKYMTVFPAADRDVQMSLANSVWYHNAYDINPTFSQTLNKVFNADVFKRDLVGDKSEVINGINQWCADHTGNLIDHIIDSYPDNMVALLANAMYFNGKWNEPFDAKDTKSGTFHGSNGDTSVSMMHQMLGARYSKGDGYTAMSMEFGNTGAYEVWLVLPNEEREITEVINGITHTNFPGRNYKNVTLTFPKFKFASDEINLEDALSSLGISELFSHNSSLALFTTPFTGGFSVSQKTSIEFSEKGAEAAAVSWGTQYTSNGEQPESVTMTFDRPFLFFINEAQSGACLMAGKIMNL